MADTRRRRDIQTTVVSVATSQRVHAMANFANAVASIVDEKRFQDVRDLPDLEMLEAATELTTRK